MAFRFSTVALAAILPIVSAQTFSSCNPMKKDCEPNPAIAANFQSDFRTGAGALSGWTATAGKVDSQGDGAHFTINQQGQSVTLQTDGYFLYGRAEVRTKASPGTGIVSSIVLQSESLDEFDWEFLGSSPNEVQVNYFGKGDTTTYDRMTRHPVSNAQANVHTYIIDWNAERTEFWIDSTRVRVLNRNDAQGGSRYPQTPMNLRIGIWAGGDPNNGQGTIAWAGGLTDFSKAPFTQVLESIKITNLSPGSAYQWTDKSGNSDSIKVIGGDAPQKPVNNDKSSAQASTPTASSDTQASSSTPGSSGSSGFTTKTANATPTNVKPGDAGSPGGLGGGNGGVTTPGSFAPEATKAVDCMKDRSNALCQTASIVTPSHGTPTGSAGNGGPTNQPGTGAGSRAAAGGVAVAAGVLGAILL